MTGEQIFLDTVFIQALLNARNQYHIKARTLLPRVQSALEVWVTEAVLIEVGNALSAFNRTAAIRFIQQCYQTPNTADCNAGEVQIIVGAQHVVPLPVYFIYLKYAVCVL